MKTKIVIAAIATAFCFGNSHQQAAAQWPQTTSHEPTVTIEFGGVAMDREGRSSSALAARDELTGDGLLTGEAATDLGSAAGVQGKIVFPSRRTLHTFEVRGSHIGWDEDVLVQNNNFDSPFLLGGVLQLAELLGIDAENPVNPILPPGLTATDLLIPTVPLSTGEVPLITLIMPEIPEGFLVDGFAGPELDNFFDAREFSSRYESDYTSIELMSRRNTRPGLTWLFGPRFISVSEQSEFTALGTSPARLFVDDGTVVTGTLDATAGLRTETRNSLVGLQLGLEYNLPITQDVYLQVNGRGGAFYNSMHVGRAVSPLLPTAASNATAFAAQNDQNDSGESWLAEVSVRAYMDLIPNSLSAYAGFDVLYVDQLALAPAQAITLAQVDNSDSLFARGLSFGCKMNY